VAILTLIFGFYPNITTAESLATIEDKIDTVSGQREALQLQVDGFNAQIKFLQDQINATDAQITENKAKSEVVKKKLKKEQDKLSGYLSELYQENQTSFLEKLFRSRSLSDFMDRSQYLDSIRTSISRTVIEVNNQKAELAKDQKVLSELQVQNALAKASLDKQLSDKQKELDTATAEEQRIRGIFATQLSKLAPGSYCKSDGKRVIKAKYSIFSFPTECGYISQGFGNTEFASIERVYGGKIHNGVDVGVDTGAPTRSIGVGTIYAKGVSPSGGWGNWAMVKHDPVKIDGKDVIFYSLYAHMVTETALKIGDRVSPATVIGFVGGTPYWAPHLHFSLFVSDSGWKDNTPGPYPGNAIDPLDYMDIPISTTGTDWDPGYLHG
jgi:murein DD-endopeptidase MepM/ murein hydrolase activator NlpD